MTQVYRERRAELFRRLGDSILIVPSAPTALRNNDVEHEYRQSSDFYYLSGFTEPHSVLVMKGGSKPVFSLFVRARDPEREIWDGRRAGVDGARDSFGADQAFPIDELEKKLPELLENVPRIHYRLGVDPEFDQRVLRALAKVRLKERRGISYPLEIVDAASLLHEMRLLKSPQEIELMERAVAITAEGHLALMAEARPGRTEYQLEATLNHVFRRAGAQRHAYPPIVGSGPNATILHYRENDRALEDGDLVLVDAGCEYEYYASDVTRTFPVSGKFTAPQRELYEVVLEAQRAAIEVTRPGATLEDIHLAAVKATTQGLISLGLVEPSLEKALETKAYEAFFMHRTSHYLGMDVHDVGTYSIGGKPRELSPGMVITIEPGLYVAAELGLVPEKHREAFAKVPERYRGIGIRIEDDVLITESGARVLSEAIPKSVSDLEQACQS